MAVLTGSVMAILMYVIVKHVRISTSKTPDPQKEVYEQYNYNYLNFEFGSIYLLLFSYSYILC